MVDRYNIAERILHSEDIFYATIIAYNEHIKIENSSFHPLINGYVQFRKELKALRDAKLERQDFHDHEKLISDTENIPEEKSLPLSGADLAPTSSASVEALVLVVDDFVGSGSSMKSFIDGAKSMLSF